MKKLSIFMRSSGNRVLHIVILIIIIIGVYFFSSSRIQGVINNKKIKPLNNKIIVVDPGHGGIDGGTYFGDILEKNINLEIGLKLKDKLAQRGAMVVMTREIDGSLDNHMSDGSRHRRDLNARVKTVNDSNADIFLSIHVNYMKDMKRMGPIVFYCDGSEDSQRLAEYTQESLNKLSAYKEKDINLKRISIPENFHILVNTSSPGVIIETGFISNEIDRSLLLNEEHQNEIVELIIEGVISYFTNDIFDKKYIQ